VYEIPAAASSAAGLEGFAVAGAAGRLGRVAAINRNAEGLTVVVDTGNDYRAVPATAVAQVERRPRVVRLTPVLDPRSQRGLRDRRGGAVARSAPSPRGRPPCAPTRAT
jgi:hypothetical protein